MWNSFSLTLLVRALEMLATVNSYDELREKQRTNHAQFKKV